MFLYHINVTLAVQDDSSIIQATELICDFSKALRSMHTKVTQSILGRFYEIKYTLCDRNYEEELVWIRRKAQEMLIHTYSLCSFKYLTKASSGNMRILLLFNELPKSNTNSQLNTQKCFICVLK